MEPGSGFGCSGAPGVAEDGGDGIRPSVPPCAVAEDGGGARSADRLRSRRTFELLRDFSRTTGLRGPDGIKGVLPVNTRVQEKVGHAGAMPLGGLEPRGRGVQRWSNRSRVARNAVKPLGRAMLR